MRNLLFCLTIVLLPVLGNAYVFQSDYELNDNQEERSYNFNEEGISKNVLENYLDRSITMTSFLRQDYAYHEDDIRLIKNIGAKFIGRAIFCWGGESRLNSPDFWNDAEKLINRIHEFDSDIIFQACLFEIVSKEVNEIKIPAWVFKDFDLPLEDRTFSYQAMLNDQGRFVDHWGEGRSVPDVSKLETRLWFYFLAGSYMNIGCEAFHLGQVELIGMNDPNRESWAELLKKIREYASEHARRHWVLLDAHVPYNGMLKDGISLIDFNSFPLRIKVIPEDPYDAKLEVNHLDALFKKSKGCITPTGWSCESLPYLVEFDNYGKSETPNEADTTSHFVWGWDEISWFSLRTEKYRNDWLKYAYNWIEKTDSAGHLEMPGRRPLTCPNDANGFYRANNQSDSCPIGYSQEKTIKELWSEYH